MELYADVLYISHKTICHETKVWTLEFLFHDTTPQKCTSQLKRLDFLVVCCYFIFSVKKSKGHTFVVAIYKYDSCTKVVLMIIYFYLSQKFN